MVSGPNLMTGYWQQPEATTAALQDGWFHSGDVATVDKDGFVYIVDRLKDMILSGGENISPAEVEEKLLDHPAVQDCAVIGVGDDHWGEVGRAIIQLKPGATADEAGILGSLRGRLAGFKIPKSVVFVDAVPRNPGGKLVKAVLRREYGDAARQT
jgi:fatty-acyl-CoA synthase